jgi:hypothetical protein
VASHILIEVDKEWGEAKTTDDPYALVAIINRTHFTHAIGANLALVKINAEVIYRPRARTLSKHLRVKERIRYSAAMHARSRYSGDGRQDFSHLVLGEARPSSARRNGGVYLTNERAAGQAFPATADGVYIIEKY